MNRNEDKQPRPPTFKAQIVPAPANRYGELTVEFLCPHCCIEHQHGWNPRSDPSRPQHRSAHCDAESPLKDAGYFLVLNDSIAAA